MNRATCGTTSPTKTIGPQAAVAAPARTATTPNAAARVRPTRWPRPRAVSSPRARPLRTRPKASDATRPTARNGATPARIGAYRPASEPTCQNRSSFRVSMWVSTIPVVTEASPAVTAAPARASLTGVAPSRPSDATAYTSTIAAIAPAKANQT